jgi:hypothetical protein
MFDQLRALVRAEHDKQLAIINVDMQFKRIDSAEGATQIAALKETTDDLLETIDAAELAAEEPEPEP